MSVSPVWHIIIGTRIRMQQRDDPELRPLLDIMQVHNIELTIYD